jgi:putative membrane protein
VPTPTTPGGGHTSWDGPGQDADVDQQQTNEPDYRFTLAAERTFLAYARTALGLFAAGVAVSTALPQAGRQTLRHAVGVLLTLLGLLVLLESRRRFNQVDRAIRAGEPLPRNRLGPLLTVGLAVIGLLAIALVLGS